MTSLMAALFLLQADSAEDTFRKIGETLQQAKSVRVTFVWEGASRTESKSKVEASGNVLLKAGNRANLLATILEKGQASELRIVSDGTTVKTRLGAKRMLECPTPKNFELGLRMAVHRLGAMQAVLISHKVCMLDTEDQEEALDLTKKPILSDFRTGADDGESRTILYKIAPDGLESVAEIKLWYAPETFRPVKRTITLKQQPGESVFTEQYKEWSLDGELENEEFTLPSVK